MFINKFKIQEDIRYLIDEKSAASIIESLKVLSEHYGVPLESLFLEINYYNAYGIECVDVELYRPMTSDELAKEQAEIAERTELARRLREKQYLELKAEFEGKEN